MMYITDNSRILSREELSTPEEITNEIPLDKESSKLIFGARRSISQILHRQDDRLIVVVGPCSIHDPKAALEYAKGVEQSRQELESKFKKTDSDYIKKFESTISSGLEAAQKELAAAIEAGDAKAQVEANKRIATLAFENAKLDAAKEGREVTTQAQQPVTNLSQGGNVNVPQTDDPINMDPKAEAWASKNPWFGTDRAMTYTAFEIHKDLTEKEGFDPSSDEYYAEVDKRIKVDFPHKFGNTDNKQTTEPVQTVASAKRSVKPGRKTVRLTSSQVAIAKKLGVPLEEYAKQLKNTKEA